MAHQISRQRGDKTLGRHCQSIAWEYGAWDRGERMKRVDAKRVGECDAKKG
jgi:hypothetical protein